MTLSHRPTACKECVRCQFLRKTPRKKCQSNKLSLFNLLKGCDVKCMCPFGYAQVPRYVLKIILDVVVNVVLMKLTFKSIDF